MDIIPKKEMKIVTEIYNGSLDQALNIEFSQDPKNDYRVIINLEGKNYYIWKADLRTIYQVFM